MVWLTWFIAAVVFMAVGVIFSPELFGPQQHPGMLTMLLKLAHLLSFSTMWGAALWVTFGGGLIMFYPSIVAPIFRGTSLAVSRERCFLCISPWSAPAVQSLWLLLVTYSPASALAFNLANLSVFTPMTIEMVKHRHKVERENGIGTEFGWSKNREVAKSNPQLATLKKKFFMIHGLSSLAHIIAPASLAMQSWYLAGNINL